MPGHLNSYNREVMLTACPHCGKVNVRCVGPRGSSVLIPAHGARLAVLGLRWDAKTQTLKEMD